MIRNRKRYSARMAGYGKPLSFSERRGSAFDNELQLNTHVSKMPQQRPRGPPTPSMSTPAADFDQQQQLTGSPPPPPTPAASPGPSHVRNWSNAEQDDDLYLAGFRRFFAKCPGPQRNRILAEILNQCTSQQLSFVHQFVSPLLKKDPFTSLPDELCLRVWRPFPCSSFRHLLCSVVVTGLLMSTDSLFH